MIRYLIIKVIYTRKGNYPTDLPVHLFRIDNIGNVNDLNRIMSHFNKYPNISESLFNLSIIIPTVVLFVTVTRIIIYVESTYVFQYK